MEYLHIRQLEQKTINVFKYVPFELGDSLSQMLQAHEYLAVFLKLALLTNSRESIFYSHRLQEIFHGCRRHVAKFAN